VHLHEAPRPLTAQHSVVAQAARTRLCEVHDSVLIGRPLGQSFIGTHCPSPSGHVDPRKPLIWVPKR
jgi:hypothetical protein